MWQFATAGSVATNKSLFFDIFLFTRGIYELFVFAEKYLSTL